MTTPYSRLVGVSSTRGSLLAYSITSIRSLPQVPLPIVAACQPSEELKALLTKTTSPSTTHTERQRFGTQHSVTNASSYSQGIKSKIAPHTDVVASAKATPTSPSSAPTRTCAATRTSARYPAGTTTTARTAPPTPLGGSHAS